MDIQSPAVLNDKEALGENVQLSISASRYGLPWKASSGTAGYAPRFWQEEPDGNLIEISSFNS